ncbi:MAG TPA: NYN domain-containing protein [Acidimicrobiia bacterium]|nr:NYN domain-containing protein [Acidimicrobiia bacterium]
MDEERIAVFLDYENLAIGARDSLGGMQFDFGPIADALAERGRVILRRAYADWSMFDEDRRMLTRHHVELIEIPQRMGASRKNAADIKLVVDAIEQAYERAYVTTFVICTGDSDFTPLVYKLRELNKRVIGVGVRASTSKLLPPACDEFLFYENLEGVEPRVVEPPPAEEPVAEDEEGSSATESLETLITRTLGGLQRSSGENVLASSLKRALLRKDSTFSEADYGYRGFGELLSDLASKGVVELGEGPAKGDPVVQIPEGSKAETAAFELLAEVVSDLAGRSGKPYLSGLKNEIRKRQADFTEKKFGYSSFLQFCRAADRRGYIQLEFDPDAGDYVVRAL